MVRLIKMNMERCDDLSMFIFLYGFKGQGYFVKSIFVAALPIIDPNSWPTSTDG
jgi:hypothetical protein